MCFVASEHKSSFFFCIKENIKFHWLALVKEYKYMDDIDVHFQHKGNYCANFVVKLSMTGCTNLTGLNNLVFRSFTVI